MGYYDFPRYVPVAERRAKALQQRKKLEKSGYTFYPIVIEGRTIAKTFWGKAWCTNLEAYSDYSNRLPRGRTYVRNGSVIDLKMSKGKIDAQVMGSSLYSIVISIKPMIQEKWKSLVQACVGKIDSLVELLQGKFSKAVMAILTEKEHGLFPKPQEITMRCSCPDSAGMCKHIAAVLYGVGASLDEKPDWLFLLRHVDHADLIATAGTGGVFAQTGDSSIDDGELSHLFGIEFDMPKEAAPIAIKEKTAKIKTKTQKKTKPQPQSKVKASVTKVKEIKTIRKTTQSKTKPIKSKATKSKTIKNNSSQIIVVAS